MTAVTATDALALLAAVVAAAGIALAAAGLSGLVRWRFLDRRIRQYVALQAAAPDRERRRRPAAGAAGLSRGLQRRLTGTSYAARVQVRLNRAGLTARASAVILLQAGLATALALAGLVAGPPSPIGRLLVALLLGALGAAGPLLWLDRMASRRLAAFERQLPQAIESMASTLQAGATLQQSLSILAREMPPPISAEFRRVLRDAELGLSFPDSLAGLANRIPSADLAIFTSAVSIQQRVGGDLAHIFRVISQTVRERLRLRGETRVLTAQARYSAYVIGALPVCLFLFLWVTNYPYLAGLFQPGLPRLLLAGGVAGMVLGFYSMQKIAAIDV
jgi:tight adherence protein B